MLPPERGGTWPPSSARIWGAWPSPREENQQFGTCRGFKKVSTPPPPQKKAKLAVGWAACWPYHGVEDARPGGASRPPARLVRLPSGKENALPAVARGDARGGFINRGWKAGEEAAGVSWSGGGMPRGASRQEPVSVYSASLINPAAGARAGGPALLVCD